MKSKKTILVIEDDEELVQLLKYRLDSMGYHVVSAHSGDTAIEMAEHEHPHLIILDIFLSDMDGLTVLKRLKAPLDIETGKPSSTKEIPVVIITGKAPMAENLTRVEGASDFFMKPIDTVKFVKRIKELVDNQAK